MGKGIDDADIQDLPDSGSGDDEKLILNKQFVKTFEKNLNLSPRKLFDEKINMESGRWSAQEARNETPQSMDLRLAALFEELARSGINVDSLRKATGRKALKVNNPDAISEGKGTEA